MMQVYWPASDEEVDELYDKTQELIEVQGSLVEIVTKRDCNIVVGEARDGKDFESFGSRKKK